MNTGFVAASREIALADPAIVGLGVVLTVHRIKGRISVLYRAVLPGRQRPPEALGKAFSPVTTPVAGVWAIMGR